MFLYDLNNEQKELFIDLAILAIESNGSIDDSEIEVLKRYCREMAVDFREKANNNDCDDVLRKLRDICSESTLKKISIEIIALMYADNNLAAEEEKMLGKLKDAFQFSTHLMGELIFVTKHLMLSLSLIQGLTLRD